MEKLTMKDKRNILRGFAKLLYQNDLYNFTIARDVIPYPDEHGFMSHKYSGNISVTITHFDARSKESK